MDTRVYPNNDNFCKCRMKCGKRFTMFWSKFPTESVLWNINARQNDGKVS